MCYKCEKDKHFITECPKAMEKKVERKHRSRNDYKNKNKNKSEWRPRKSGGHKKKMEHAMVAGASGIDSSSCYTSSSSSDEEEDGDRHKGKWLGKNSTACASPPKAFVA
jgi:hypothetical protein